MAKITLLELLPNASSMPHLSSSLCFPSTCDLCLDLCVQHSSSAVFGVWDVFFSSSYHFLLYLTIYKYHATCKKALILLLICRKSSIISIEIGLQPEREVPVRFPFSSFKLNGQIVIMNKMDRK